MNKTIVEPIPSGGGITLKAYDVSEIVFDSILDTLIDAVYVTDHINLFYKGYHPSRTIVYNNKDTLIIREHLLAMLADFTDEDYKGVESWRQVIVRKVVQQEAYTYTIDGSRAFSYVKGIFLRYYTVEEYTARLKEHQAPYDPGKIQLHYTYPSKGGVLHHQNCVKYDINGAHQDALIEIFPRAEKELRDIYNRRKQKPILKSYVNFYVGMLCRKGFRGTYNWIVQRTTGILVDSIRKAGGTLIYANTDGFIVRDPERELTTSNQLGGIKIEHRGSVYTYQDDNYWVYQAGSKIIGSVRYKARALLDLPNGGIAKYDIRREDINGIKVERLDNLRGIKVDVYKEG